MSSLTERLLGLPSSSPVEGSEMSGSFQSGSDDYEAGQGAYSEDDYEYSSDSGVYHQDHYGVHSGGNDYHSEKCCPLVVDALCLAAILFAIAGATLFLSRVFQVELCMVNGAAVTTFVANCRAGRRKRSRYDRPWRQGQALRLLEGNNKKKFNTLYNQSFDIRAYTVNSAFYVLSLES